MSPAALVLHTYTYPVPIYLFLPLPVPQIGFYNWLGYYAQSVALTTTTASKACFIGSLAVVVVPALDTLAGVKKTNTAKPDQSGGGILEALNGPWFPAFLAAAGVASLELVGAEGDPPNVGDAWALVQPVW